MESDEIDEIRSILDDVEGSLPESVDRATLERMHTVAHVLDKGIRVPGTEYRFGLDPIVGILPGAGDSAVALVSLYLVAESARMGVSQSTLLRMVANIAVDVLGGSVPVLGVLFDAFWKANSRNLRLALEDLADKDTVHESDPNPVPLE